MLSPLFKSGGASKWASDMKLPSGMSTAEAKYLMTKYKYQEALEIPKSDLDKIMLKEHPDHVKTKKDDLYSGTQETISFGINGSNLQN